MKKLNLFSRMCSPRVGAQKDESSSRYRLVTVSLPCRYRLWPHLGGIITALFLLLGIGNAWGAGAISVTSSAITLPAGSTSVGKGAWMSATGESQGYWSKDVTVGSYGTITCSNAGDQNSTDYLLQLKASGGYIQTTINSPAGVDITIGLKKGSSGTLTVSLTGATDKTYTSTSWGTLSISTTNTSATFKVTKTGSNAAGISYITITPKSGGGGGTTYAVTYNANSGSGTMTDGSSPYTSGSTVTTKPNEFTRSEYIFTKWNTQAGGGGTNYAEGATFTISAATTLYAQWVASSLRDDITCTTTGVTSSSYTSWSGKSASNSKKSPAVYAGCSAKGNSVIQLNSTSGYGIISTTSGGKVKYVSVVWESHTTAGRTIEIYGKNTAYSEVSELNSSSTYGTKLGTIECGKNTVLAVSGDYKYIGIRSSSGALYLTSISIEWTPVTLSSIAITTPPTTRKYLAGETFSKTGAVVTATYSDASTNNVSASATWTPTAALTAGTSQTVTASYTESGVTKTATTTIDVYSISFTKQDEDGAAISAEGVTTTASGKSITAAVGSTNYFFKQWTVKTASGMSVSSPTNAGTTLTGTPTGNVELIAVYYKPRVILWKVNNAAYTSGSPTATVKYNTQWKLLTLPTDPVVGSYCGEKFAGWTTTDMGENSYDKDDDADDITALNLMTSANKSEKTTVIENDTTTFHAVFADYAE